MKCLARGPRRLLLQAALILAAVMAPVAQAFPDDEARRAILELREQLRQATSQNRQTQLRLADQIEALKQEVASLRGKVEQLSFQNSSQQDNNPASGGNAGVDPQEQAAYDVPASQFRSGAYGDAAKGFALFLEAYPDSPLAADARFFHGSSLYATKGFKNAIQSLQTLVKNEPEHARAPDALLVIAASQTELNDLKSARATLQRIVKDYPGANAAATAKDRLKLLQ